MADDFDTWLAGRTRDEEDDGGELLPGTIVGSCRLCAFLGCGGFAEVYRATDEAGRDVAVKILHRLDEKSRLRFERESRILAQVRHPNFPRFYGFGSCGERPYVITELLQPCELPKGDRPVARFLTKVMSAVEELHRIGFVHRDIKPTNVLCRSDGEPVLNDFGLVAPISAVTREREGLSVDGRVAVAVGTAGFSAPEQFTGQASGRAADVHALGALIAVCFGERMPRSWKRIYLTATNSNPAMRYQTVGELRRAVGRRHLRLGLAVLAAFLVVGSLAAAFYHLQPPSSPPETHHEGWW